MKWTFSHLLVGGKALLIGHQENIIQFISLGQNYVKINP